MPRDSGGAYSLPIGYLAVTGDPILASQHNPPLEDLGAAITASLPRDGTAPMTGDLPMGGNKVTGLGTPTATTDAVTKDYVDTRTSFTPVQQGGGTAQLTDKVYLGWDGGGLRAQVNSTDLGKVWTNFSAAAALGASGYQKFPNGLIIQWGNAVVTTASEIVAVSFPLAFPSTVFAVVPVNGDTLVSTAVFGVHGTPTKNAFILRTVGVSGTVRVQYVAIGV